jgi:hypothetical protein
MYHIFTMSLRFNPQSRAGRQGRKISNRKESVMKQKKIAGTRHS